MDIIENIKKVTPLGAFFYNALLLQTYGPNLFWEDRTEMTFCLKCTHKRKKEYTETVEKIFKDYNIFKNKDKRNKRKPNGDKELRTALLNAMKDNAYVALDKERSSNDEKFCSFTQRFKAVFERVTRQRELSSGPVEEITYMDPTEEVPILGTGMGEDLDGISLYSEDPFVNATSFDFTDVEPHDIQFDLPIEAESIIWSNNHPMVTEKENQEPKSPELLKGSRT